MYLALEGIDTCGKTTQMGLLKNAYPDAVFTKEPGGTAVGAKLREIALEDESLSDKSRFLIFLADRSEHIDKVVRPALLQDKTVISDRSVVSGIAYAYKKIDERFLLAGSLFATDSLLPQKIVLLHLGQDELTKRLAAKRHDAIERQGIEYLLGVQDAMERYIGRLGITYLKLNAASSIEAIHNEIRGFIDDK